MTKRLSHVAPLQLGVVSAALYAILSLIILPFFLLFGMIASHLPSAHGQAIPGGSFVLAAVILPVMYAVFGFIGGVLAAFVYNLVAGWTGGIEFTFVDVAPALPPHASQSTNF